MPTIDLAVYDAFKVTHFLIGNLTLYYENANLRRCVSAALFMRIS